MGPASLDYHLLKIYNSFNVTVFEELITSGWMSLGYTKYPLKECERPPKRCLTCRKFSHKIISCKEPYKSCAKLTQ
ncbi:hypothetical protein BpHYR1_016251 [Brachionus plicatilis]|uniref:Uncharacterized protein n=1 Tax=Brachionus plicatilis TaxID=10195 RepID=A0A3M7RJ41_BRAPC|nr:hypothetical protein BpHYR1_016251 [Brachionus plicatilis]